jgi:hypothetical protein
MTTNHALKSILDLDLDPIKVKLMHKQSGEGWDLAKANAVEVEYKRFLHLSHVFPNEQIAPTHDVDTFWHYHILDTMKYAEDCQQAFGYFMHHFPYLGMRGEDDEAELRRCGERMSKLYEESFGTPYPGNAADSAGAGQTAAVEAAYCLRNATYRTGAGQSTAAVDAAYCLRSATYHSVTGQTTAAIDAAYCLRNATYRSVTGQAAAIDAAYCLAPPTQARLAPAATATGSFNATRPQLAAA